MLICSQRGVILIIVLWFVVIATIIIAVLASETRLSAKAVFYNKMGLQTWNDTLKALRAAEMEVLFNMDRTYEPLGVEDIPLSERKKNKYRFDGRAVDNLFHYPKPERVTVRIYDHAGKIKLSWSNLYKLLKKRMPNDPEKLGELKDAWDDWFDEDDDKRLNGAEKDYYETLSPPYEPRNDRKARNIETVEELLLIKGFAELFKGVEISNAFTLYSNTNRIDPNLATPEALMVLGLDSETIKIILTKRREEEFKNKSNFNEFMEPEQLTEFLGWVSIPSRNISTSRYYTIAIQSKKPEEIAKLAETKEDDTVNTDTELDELDETTSQQKQEKQRAYMVTVKTEGKNKRPRILMVIPYGVLPDTSHEQQFLNDDDNHSKKPLTPFK